MASDQVWTQVVIGIAAIITTYITTKHGPKLTDKLRGLPSIAPNRDRYGLMFDGYERLIKELQTELSQSRTMNDKQSVIIEKMQDKVNVLQDKLHEAQTENRKLNRKLNAYGENGVT